VVVAGSRRADGRSGGLSAHRRADLSPFNAWVFLKGLETLRLRMQAHCASALQWRSGWSSSPA
jgi:O-succinylhomoserine sulfhydrylase